MTDRVEFINVNFDFIRLLLQEIITNQLTNQYYSAFFSGDNGVLPRIKQLQERYPKINPSLTPVQLLRSIVGPVMAYIFQTKLFNVPAADNDLVVVQQQIINNLTKQGSRH